MTSNPSRRARKATDPSPLIVGFGASAGGLEAFKELLAAIGVAPGMALVFVQHLDPAGDSLLAGLLSDATTMNVVPLTATTTLQAETVYVAPPHTLIDLKGGIVSLSQAPPSNRHPATIDHFFHAIADDQAERGVGVILSGTGSDGTLGLKAISDQGGLTFAQSEESARFDSMPRSAAITGVADHVMTPTEIANELLNYSQHITELGRSGAEDRMHDQIEESIPTIAELLMNVTNHNFQHYKTNTLIRRIQRRMQVRKIRSTSRYVEQLRGNQEEVQSLFRELLIGVTAFFRDPDAFAALKETVLPKLFEQRVKGDTVRIWVAGCANGAEPYSMAMLCREVMEEANCACDVQIFATDIDERALDIARNGVYPVGIEDHVSSERLTRFFVKRGKQYQVAKEIRDIVLFSAHNLISDPPFSRQDLISCRNLLIYLGPHLQNKLIPLFHYALRPNGYLFLGPSETITTHGELFRALDAKHRISQRKGTAIGNTPSLSLRQNSIVLQSSQDKLPDTAIDLTAIRQRIVLDEFAPKACVIDASCQVLNAASGVQKYLTIAEGDFHNNIIKMAASSLRIGLRAAIAEAKKTTRKVVHENMSLRVGDLVQRVMITVQPMPQLGEHEPLFMIVFHDVGTPSGRDESEYPNNPRRDNADEIISQMESELETTRNDLEQSMQDMEAANEELKSSNEELLSINEELQSANEELETSKEEIRASSDAVTLANTDLENLLRSTQIATIFLDDDLRIRSFTPAISILYDLISTDIGRRLEGFVPHTDRMPPLPAPKSIRSGDPIEDTVVAHSGRIYIRRVLPYRTHIGEDEGIVVTFTDVTDLKASEHRFRSTFENAAVGIAHVSLEGRWLMVNQRLCGIVGYTESELLSKSFQDITHPDDLDADLAQYQRLISGEIATYSMHKRYLRLDHKTVWINLTVSMVRNQAGDPQHAISIIQDITQQKLTETRLTESEALVRTIAENSTVALIMMDDKGYVTYCNASWLAMTGYDAEEIKTKPLHELVHHHYPDGRPFPMSECPIDRALPEDFSVRAHEDLFFRKDGTSFEVTCAARPIYKDGKPFSTVLEVRDVTEQNEARRDLAARESHLRHVIDGTLFFIGVLTPDGTLVEVNQVALDAGGITRDEVLGKPFWECYWWKLGDSAVSPIQLIVERGALGETYRGDLTYRVAGNQLRTVDFSLNPIFGEQGQVVYLIPSGCDVSDRVTAEKALADSKLRLELSMELSDIAPWSWDIVNNDIVADANLKRLYGLEPDSVVNLERFNSLIAEEDRYRVKRAIDRAIEDGATYDEEYAILLPDGQKRWLRARGQSLRHPDGSMQDFFGMAIDITYRKNREIELADREAHLRRVINNQLGLVGVIDRSGNLVEVDDRSLAIAKVKREEVIGKPFAEAPWWTYDPAVVERIRNGIDRAFSGETVRFDVSLFADSDDGIFIDFMLAPAFDDKGGIDYLIPSGVDIRDRRVAEQKLKDNERRATMALQAGGMAAWEWTPGSNFWEPKLYELLGIDPEQEPSTELFFRYVHPEDLPLLDATWKRATAGEDGYATEFRIVRPDGEIKWLAAVGMVTRSEDGSVVAMHGLNWDITERKDYEQRIRTSEERLRLALSAAELSFWQWDADSNTGHWSEGPIGDKSSLFSAKGTLEDFFSKIHRADRRHVEQSLRQSMASGEPYRAEYRTRRNGNIRWVLSLAHHSNRGSAREMIGIEMDITDRKRAELDVQMGAERLSAAAAAAGFGMFSIDLQTGVMELSPELKAIVGYAPDYEFELSHDQLPPFIHEDDREEVALHFQTLRGKPDIDSSAILDHRVINSDGDVRWVRLQTKAVLSKRTNKPTQIIGTLLDITSQRGFEKQLSQARVAAEAANQSKSAFVANLSHEIRTPMTAILGYADLIREMIDQPEAVGHLQTIRRNGDYLLDIINDILDLSKIEAGKLEIRSERFEPVRIIEDVRSVMEIRAVEGGLSLEVEYEGKLPKFIESDSKRLKQILINLVGNAIKFTREGGVRIRVRYVAEEKRLHIEVIDTGVGMSLVQKDRLFKPFSQGDSTVSRNFGGTGLGLAISKRLAEMLGGKISVESTEGVGSKFTVAIAIGAARDPELVDYSNEVAATKFAHVASLEQSTPTLACRVLVVDDRRDIRFLSRRFLTLAGAVVDECEDGQLALDHVAACIDSPNCPDLILLDMQMPNLDGYETARALRKLGYDRPIIALTADAMQGDMDACLKAGCNDYLSKPIDTVRLITLVSAMTADLR